MMYREAQIYPADLNHDIKKWYVIYFYYNSNTHQFDRFRVYENINRYKGIEKESYARTLRDAVNYALRCGYTPFSEDLVIKNHLAQAREKRVEEKKKAQDSSRKENYTVLQAMKYFMDAKTSKGNAEGTISRYQTGMNFFKEWLNERKMLLTPICSITAEHVLSYLEEYEKKRGWTGKTYNNQIGTMHTFFNYLALPIQGIIHVNPIKGAETKTTLAQKHAAYTWQQVQQIITLVRKRKDILMEGLVLTSYYACVRAKEEMRHLRAGNILFERDLIKLDAEGTKARREDYIPLDPELKRYFLEHQIDKLPADWFIFGHGGRPGPEMAYKNMYATRFREYRDNLGIDARHTLYGFKHTRNIDLVRAGVSPYDLMVLNRHKNIDETMTYLRDLGLAINHAMLQNSKKL